MPARPDETAFGNALILLQIFSDASNITLFALRPVGRRPVAWLIKISSLPDAFLELNVLPVSHLRVLKLLYHHKIRRFLTFDTQA